VVQVGEVWSWAVSTVKHPDDRRPQRARRARRRRAATVTWTDAGSFWDIPTDWSSNPPLRGASDDVVIDVGGGATITHRTGTDTIHDNNHLSLTGGSLPVTGAYSSTGDTSISGGSRVLNRASALNTFELSRDSLWGARPPV
jgi:hypothetical protein